YFIEIKNTTAASINIGEHLYGESGLYILDGEVSSEGNTFGPKNFLVAKNASICEFTLAPNSTVYIFGGEPFPEERFIYWNFVATSRELIEEAKDRWLKQEFPKVPGE